MPATAPAESVGPPRPPHLVTLSAALRADRRFLAAVLVLALLLRLGYAAVGTSVAWPDTATYLQAGQQLWSGQTLGSHLVMPLYPLLLAAVGWQAMPAVQAVLASVTVAAVYLIALEVFQHRTVARWAAVLMAIEPLSIFYANQRMTETLFLALLCAALLALYRRRVALASVLLVLSILVRPSIELLAPLLVALFVGQQSPRRRLAAVLRALSVYALVYAVLMAPWWLHNAQKYGRFVRLNLGDGIVLRMEHNPLFVQHGFWERLGPIFDEHADEADPIERNRKRREAALAFVREDPLRYAALSVRRLGRFFSPLLDQSEHPPFLRRARWPFFIAACLVYAGVVAWALQRRRRCGRRLAPLLLVIGYFTLLHTLTNALVRYRAPVMPLIVVVAAAGWQRAAARWPGREAAPVGLR